MNQRIGLTNQQTNTVTQGAHFFFYKTVLFLFVFILNLTLIQHMGHIFIYIWWRTHCLNKT